MEMVNSLCCLCNGSARKKQTDHNNYNLYSCAHCGKFKISLIAEKKLLEIGNIMIGLIQQKINATPAGKILRIETNSSEFIFHDINKYTMS